MEALDLPPPTPTPASSKISAYARLSFTPPSPLSPDSKEFSFYLQKLSVSIGRRIDPASSSSSTEPVDVDLGPHKSISRVHATIQYGPSGWVINCLGRNGLSVDGVWIPAGQKSELSSGSNVQIASRAFKFVLPKQKSGTIPGWSDIEALIRDENVIAERESDSEEEEEPEHEEQEEMPGGLIPCKVPQEPSAETVKEEVKKKKSKKKKMKPSEDDPAPPNKPTKLKAAPPESPSKPSASASTPTPAPELKPPRPPHPLLTHPRVPHSKAKPPPEVPLPPKPTLSYFQIIFEVLQEAQAERVRVWQDELCGVYQAAGEFSKGDAEQQLLPAPEEKVKEETAAVVANEEDSTSGDSEKKSKMLASLFSLSSSGKKPATTLPPAMPCPVDGTDEIVRVNAKLTLADICDVIALRFAWFGQNRSSGWQSSVRHNLSSHSAFVKLSRIPADGQGKAVFWAINPDYVPPSAKGPPSPSTASTPLAGASSNTKTKATSKAPPAPVIKSISPQDVDPTIPRPNPCLFVGLPPCPPTGSVTHTSDLRVYLDPTIFGSLSGIQLTSLNGMEFSKMMAVVNAYLIKHEAAKKTAQAIMKKVHDSGESGALAALAQKLSQQRPIKKQKTAG